jgi:ribonucleoside-diphosphate reductase alpha chain
MAGKSTRVEMSPFAWTQYQNKYAHQVNGRKEVWEETAERVVKCVMGPYMPDLVPKVTKLVEERKFMPAGRYLYGAGKRDPYCNNCFLFRAQDSREGWGWLQNRTAVSLMVGGGIGIVYSDLRPRGWDVCGLGGQSTGPVALACMINEQGRYTQQGGSRRSAIWAGLHWWHPDAPEFVKAKNWGDYVREGKRRDFNFIAPLDMTNISVILDDDFFDAYSTPGWRRQYRMWGGSFEVTHEWASRVYWDCVRGMLESGEPGFSVNVGENAGEDERNACCEVTSADDDDMCNLASLVMSRFDDPAEFAEACELGMAFLICGTLYSLLPVQSMYKVREKNRRTGLGLMGVHEWLLKRGRRYGPDSEMGRWLESYQMSGAFARKWCDRLSVSRPKATRAVAPNGTIGIVAETTTSAEPILYVARKRRYLDNGTVWKWQYEVDPTAHRLVKQGVPPDAIEDSLSLAEDVERRIAMQAWLQRYVDHGISSTVNLPPWGSACNNENGVTRFGNTLFKYLPDVRGMTTYPDGARGGQPFVKVPYEEAIGQLGVEFVESGEAACVNGVCGS